MGPRIDPMKKKAKMLRKHKLLILNCFRARGEFSSGIGEGLKMKARLTARKSYEFINPKMQKIVIYHSLENFPVPEWTHKFC